jgi:hypothetical protein
MIAAWNSLEAEMDTLYSVATEHLILHLQPLNRALRAAVENQRLLASRLAAPQLASLCLTDEHVNVLLDQVDVKQSHALPGIPATLNEDEQSVEKELRARCAVLGAVLPLDHMICAFELSTWEQEALLICVAPEFDRTYERIYGFILDDLNRRFPSIDLLISLTSSSVEQRLGRRHGLASAAKLRRLNILQAFGDPPVELRQELRLAPGIFEFLTGVPMDISSLCRDRDGVQIPEEIAAPATISLQEFAHLREALSDGSISVLGLWGARQNGPTELVLALANAVGIPLRRLRLDPELPSREHAQALERQVRMAASLGAAVWFDTDALMEPSRARIESVLAEYLANAPVLVFLTGENPWRPAAVLRNAAYAECELAAPPQEDRARLWSKNLPELAPIELDQLASRYTLSSTDIRAVSSLTRLRARLAGNGHPEPVQDHVAAACSLITRPGSSQFGIQIQPRRGPDDLILPPNLHRQVLEVAKFYDLSSQVDRAWGFGRLAVSTGLKALFTGDPGTGKTLSAEVIAGLLGLPLLKVDLARVVSKWVGETEKNLDSAFREAEETHSILFFDEAEALFGKRGEVDHGTDRYANLEVSYLLQRLEMSPGLIILASNVKDQIDNAFVRRFQIVIHFPKPGVAERLCMWQHALPQAAPLAKDIDYNALAKLDMTGAAIVSSARTAAFLAADANDPEITMGHLIRATARQYRREARVLMPTDLGSYGVLLQGAP